MRKLLMRGMSMRAAAAITILMHTGLALQPVNAAETAIQALRAVKIYPAPDAAPIHDGVVQVRGSRIVAIGPRDEHSDRLPSFAPACDGGVLMAGFQNSHVHLIGSAFADARTAPAASLSKGLIQLLTRYGFTTAFDIASDRDNTLALRARVDSGELNGPRILTNGLPLFPAHGLPGYIDHMSPFFLAKLPQPATASSALISVRQNLDAGAEATKLFLVTPQRNGAAKRMPHDIAAAAADETHRRGRLVFAHPTDLDGVRAALRANVDILAHPPLGTPGPWPSELLDQLRLAGMHMVPTLKLLKYELTKEKVPTPIAERILQDTVQQFGRFTAGGGRVLFGTDVDYMSDFDPTEEYELMSRAGMSPMEILQSLTTTPAELWNEAQRRGRIAPGMDADMVVLEGDPSRAANHFATVKCTVRGGLVIYSK